MKKLAATVALSVSLLNACGGDKKEHVAPVKMQTAAEEVLRIGETWASVTPEKGILSPPSKISVFETHSTSELRLAKEGGTEVLQIAEEIKLRTGEVVRCTTRFEHSVVVRWGRRQGEAAVEITRPQVTGPRNCDGLHPEGPIAQSSKKALFVLRSDNLVAIEPRLDKRVYISRAL